MFFVSVAHQFVCPEDSIKDAPEMTDPKWYESFVESVDGCIDCDVSDLGKSVRSERIFLECHGQKECKGNASRVPSQVTFGGLPTARTAS